MFSKIRVKYLLKNYVIFLGGGGEVIKRLHWITGGRRGGLGTPKKDNVIFEWSLTGDSLKLKVRYRKLMEGPLLVLEPNVIPDAELEINKFQKHLNIGLRRAIKI